MDTLKSIHNYQKPCSQLEIIGKLGCPIIYTVTLHSNFPNHVVHCVEQESSFFFNCQNMLSDLFKISCSVDHSSN